MTQVGSNILGRSKEFEILELKYRSAGDWVKLVHLYQETAQQGGDQSLIVSQFLKAGVVSRDKLKNPQQASAYFSKAVQFLEKRIEAEPQAVAKSDLKCELAKVFMEVIHDREKAVEQYVGAFELDPNKTHLMMALGDIYAEKVDWSDVVAHYGQEAKASQDPKLKAKVLGEIADIYTLILSDPEGAVTKYREILAIDRTNQKAADGLESLLIKGKKWEDLVAFYLDLKQHTKDKDRILTLCTKLGLIYRDKLNQLLDAIAVYEELLLLQPNNFRIAAKVKALKEDKDGWRSAVEALQKKTDSESIKDLRIGNLLKIAEIYETYLSEHASAVRRLEEALEISPWHAKSVAAAERIWAIEGAWNRIADTLERAGHEARSSLHQVPYYRRLASICIDKLNDPQRAMAALEALLKIDSKQIEARQNLLSLYERHEMWIPLERLLSQIVPTLDGEAQLKMLVRLADLRESTLSDKAGAIKAYEQILEGESIPSPVLKALERLYTSAKRWEDLIRVYDLKAEQLKVGPEQGVLFLAQAKIFEERLNNFQEAARAYERALLLVEDPSPIFTRVEQIYFKEKSWNDLAALYRRSLVKLRSTPEQVKILFKLAELYEQKLGQIDDALACLESILQRSPSDGLALQKLEQIFHGRGDWKALAGIYAKQIESTETDSEKVTLLLKLGEIQLKGLKEEQAAEETFRHILKLDPQSAVAIGFLSDFYRKSDRKGDLVHILEARLTNLEDPQPRSRVLFQLGRLLEASPGQTEEAARHYEDAVSSDPTFQECRSALSQLYRREGKYRDYARILEGQLDQSKDRIAAAQIASEIARTFLQQLSAPGEAIPYFIRSLEFDPSNVEILNEVISTVRSAGNPGDALPYCERAFELTSDPLRKAQLCLEIGALYGDVQKDTAAEARWVEKTFSYDPRNAAAVGRLQSLYEGLENWEALLKLYERIVAGATDRQAAQIHFRMGEIYERSLGSPERALVAYQVASDMDLEYRDPLSAMRRLFRGEENWGEYLRTTLAETQLVNDAGEKASLFFETARLWNEKFLQSDRAIRDFEEGIKFNEKDESALAYLARLYAQKKEFPRARELFSMAIQSSDAPDRKKQYLGEIGELELKHLNRPAEAQLAFREILSIEPRNRHALNRMAEIADRLGDHKGKLSALQMLLEVEPTAKQKVEILLSIAQLWMGPLNAPSNAVQAIQAALAVDPGNYAAIELLGTVIPSAEDWSRISVRIMESLVKEKEIDSLAKAAIAIARVYRERFKKLPDSIQILQNVLATTGEREDLLDALIPLYVQANEHLAAADTSLKRAKLLVDERERAKALIQVAGLWSEQLNNPHQAIAALEEAFTLIPTDEALTDRLLALYEETGEWSKAAGIAEKACEQVSPISRRFQDLAFRRMEILASRLDRADEALTLAKMFLSQHPAHKGALSLAAALSEKAGDFSGTVGYLKSLVELSHGAERIDVHTRQADLYIQKLNSPENAAFELEAILHLDPQNLEALNRLASLFEANGDLESLIKTLQRKIPLLKGPTELAQAYRKIGQVIRERLKDEDRAVEFFEQSFAIDPTQNEITEVLTEYYREHGRHSELADILEKSLQKITGVPSVPVLLELAELWMDRLQNSVQALDFLNRIVSIDRKHRPALERCAIIYRQSENYRSLAWCYRELANLAESAQDKMNFLSILGAVQADKLSAPKDAIDTYERILKLAPKDPEAMRRLRELFGTNGRWKDLANVLKALVENVRPEESTALLRELAIVQVERTRDTAGAVQTLKQLATLEPSDDVIFEQLSRLYEELGKFKDLSQLLAERAEQESSEERRYALLKRLAVLCDDRLSDPNRAAEAFENLLTRDPKDLEAATRLEGIYRKMGKPLDAARVVERSAGILSHGPQRTSLLKALSEEWVGAKRPEDAIRCLRLLADDPAQEEPALERILSLQRESAPPKETADTLAALANLTKNTAQRTTRLIELARWTFTRLENLKAAEHLLKDALKLSPHSPDAIDTLSELYGHSSAWRKAADLLEGELPHEKEHRRRTILLSSLAEIYRHHLKNAERAAQLYEELIGLSPHDTNALAILSDLYFQRKSWDQAAPILNRLVKVSVSKKDPGRAALLFHQLGVVMRHLNHPDDAIIHFNQSLSYDPHFTESVRALADLYYELGQWNNALLMLKRVLDLGQGTDQIFLEQNYYKLIQSLHHLKSDDEALQVFESGKKYLSSHLACLKLIASILIARQSWKDALSVQERIFELAESKTDQIDADAALAQIHIRNTKELDKARERLNHLFSLDPQHREGLELYAEVCVQQRDWPDALQTLENLISIETDPIKLSEIHFRAGRIHDRETGDLHTAKAHYLKAIAHGPKGHSKAIEAIEQFCQNREDWESLEKVHLDLAEKLTKQHLTLQVSNILMSLSTIYFEKLNHPSKGLETLRKAAELSPKSQEIFSRLGRILLTQPESREEAASIHQRLVQIDPTNPAYLREAASVFASGFSNDAAFLFRSILIGLGQARPEELNQNTESVGTIRFGKPPIHRAFFQGVLPDEIFTPLAELFGEIGETLIGLYTKSARPASVLSASETVPEQTKDALEELSKILPSLSKKMQIYYSSAVPIVELEFTKTPALAVGAGLYKLPSAAQRFVLANVIATHWLGGRILHRLSADDADDLLDALFSIAYSRKPRREGAESLVHAISTELSNQNIQLIQTLLKSPNAKISLPREQLVEAFDKAQERIAVILCNDPAAAVEAGRQVNPDRLPSLLRFISSEYFIQWRKNLLG